MLQQTTSFRTYGLRANYNNNSAIGLDNDQLRRLVPSAFAESATADRSHRYAHIPTHNVVEAMRKEGFFPVAAMESRARSEEKVGYTKHLIRFRRHDGFKDVGELLPEVCLLNSHDGTTSYQLSAGLYRLVCRNGLIVADSTIETVKVRHSGNVVDSVIEGTFRVIERVPEAQHSVESMQSIQLPERAQAAFANAALALRWDGDQAPIQAEQLNRIRRTEDRGADLWRTFNRVQENMIQGGLRGRNSSGGRMSTRAVGSVGENVRLNKALWTLAEEMRGIMSNH